MIIKDTARNIEKAARYKRNFNYSISVAEVEPFIDGAVIQCDGLVDIHEADRMFHEFVTKKTGFSDDEYSQLFHPIKRISGFDFMMNPFLKNISIGNISNGDISITQAIYQQNEFAILDEPSQDKTMLRKYAVGIFDSMTYTYVLKCNDMVWMSVNPMEIKTIGKAILHATGNVLVLGGGLGYYPYMVSLKDNVESITIVEQNKTIKDILDISILPQFPNKKASIILDDAFTFMKKNSGKKYDSIFIDIWPDNVQGAKDYAYFVKFEEKYPEARFDYWLEDSILDNMIVNIYQYFGAKLGTKQYQNFFAMTAPDLWEYLESIHDTVSRPDQMDYYLTRAYAKETIKKMGTL